MESTPLSVELNLSETLDKKGLHYIELTKNIVGTDLAKNTLQVCHISTYGESRNYKVMGRQKVKEFLARLSCYL